MRALKAVIRQCGVDLPRVEVQLETSMQQSKTRHRALQARIAALKAEQSELEEVRNRQAAEQHWIDRSFQQVAKQKDEADDRVNWLMERLVQLFDLKSPEQVSGHFGDVLSHLENGERCRSEQLQCLRSQLEDARSENSQKAIQLANELHRSRKMRSEAHKLFDELLTNGDFSCIADRTHPQQPAVPEVAVRHLADGLQTTVDRIEEQLQQLEAVHQALPNFDEKQRYRPQSSSIPSSLNRLPAPAHQALAAPTALQSQPDSGAGFDVQETTVPCPRASATGGDDTKLLLSLELRMRKVLAAAQFSDVVVRLDDGFYQLGDSVRARIYIHGNLLVASTDGITDEPFEALISRMKLRDHGQQGVTVQQLAMQRPERAAHVPATRAPRTPVLRSHSSDRLVQNRRERSPATGSRIPRPWRTSSGRSRASSRSCSPAKANSAATVGSLRNRHAPTGDGAAGSPCTPPAVLPTTPSNTLERQGRPAVAGRHRTSFARMPSKQQPPMLLPRWRGHCHSDAAAQCGLQEGALQVQWPCR